MLKKSARAMLPSALARTSAMRSAAVIRVGRPAAFRMRRIVDRPTRCPTFFSAPWIRVWPQVGFSNAIHSTKRRSSRRTLRRPGSRAYVHFCAIGRRCHRSSVSGVAIVAISRSAARPTR